ncbi:MAG: FtsX-like permease family protein [Acidobacteriota bacterium]
MVSTTDELNILSLALSLFFEGLLLLHPQSVPRLDAVKLDALVLMFNIGLVVFATLAAGLIPALRLTRIDSQQKLKDGVRGSGGRLSSRTRSVLVVSQITLATVLLMGAGLLLRSSQHLMAADPGFRPEQVATAQLTLPRERYADLAARQQFYRQVIEQVEAQPGVISAAAINLLPMGGSTSDWSITAEGYTAPNPDSPDFVQYRIVTPRYFETLGIPVRQGRSFNQRDGSDGRRVAILSQSLAKKFWGDQDPIGKRINNGWSKPNWLTVVGVVGEVHHSGSRQGNIPIWYQPISQDCWNDMSLAVRSAGDPAKAISSLKAALAKIDPYLPLYNARLMPQLVAEVLSQDRFNANLLLAFAGLALGLAAIGIFGVISYSVSQRTREIGIRMALGAHRERILGQVMREGLSLILIGLAVGLAAALLLTRFMQALLFGVAPSDPLTFVSIAVVLVASGVAACLGPARRATRVDPMIALRCE